MLWDMWQYIFLVLDSSPYVGVPGMQGTDMYQPRELTGVDASFIFHPWVTRGYPKFHILMVSVQPAHINSHQARSFDPAQHYPILMSHTVTLGAIHFTHQPRLNK
jgi:hypothetical protein